MTSRIYARRHGSRGRRVLSLHNPQQNGPSKRKNQSIINIAKAMIHDHGLPMFLLAEACNTTIYLQNSSFDSILEDKTLEELFTGVKPKIGHLRIIGCSVIDLHSCA